MTAILVLPEPDRVTIAIDSQITRGDVATHGDKITLRGGWLIAFCGSYAAFSWATMSDDAAMALGAASPDAAAWRLGVEFAHWVDKNADREATLVIARDGKAWQILPSGCVMQVAEPMAFGDPVAPLAAYHAYMIGKWGAADGVASVAARQAVWACTCGSTKVGGPVRVFESDEHGCREVQP